MSCNTCRKSFSLFHKERGCPNCGFSYCSKCLNNKVLLATGEKKVCAKCKEKLSGKAKPIPPPDAYFKRLETMVKDASKDEDENCDDGSTQCTVGEVHELIASANPNGVVEERNETCDEVRNRQNGIFKKEPVPSETEIRRRLNNLRADDRVPSDQELHKRLARLRGYSLSSASNKPILRQDFRTEQEQADDLLKQYMNEAKVDRKYEEEFDEEINSISNRLQKLKGTDTTGPDPMSELKYDSSSDSSLEHISDISDILNKIR